MASLTLRNVLCKYNNRIVGLGGILEVLVQVPTQGTNPRTIPEKLLSCLKISGDGAPITPGGSPSVGRLLLCLHFSKLNVLNFFINSSQNLATSLSPSLSLVCGFFSNSSASFLYYRKRVEQDVFQVVEFQVKYTFKIRSYCRH